MGYTMLCRICVESLILCRMCVGCPTMCRICVRCPMLCRICVDVVCGGVVEVQLEVDDQC